MSISYQSGDEVGNLAENFRKTTSTLGLIINDLSYILEEFAKGNFDVHSKSNSAASEEASATSEELSAEAVALDELVNKFKLRNA